MKNNNKFTVLIAEDEYLAMNYLKGLADKRPEFEAVEGVKDGQTALEKLLNNEYDILFLDLNLPIISGVEILKQLKNPPYVIFTTAFADPALNALNLFDMDYLYKPFSEEMFNKAVDKAINVLGKRSGNDSNNNDK